MLNIDSGENINMKNHVNINQTLESNRIHNSYDRMNSHVIRTFDTANTSYERVPGYDPWTEIDLFARKGEHGDSNYRERPSVNPYVYKRMS
jgi:hypothetical protein